MSKFLETPKVVIRIPKQDRINIIGTYDKFLDTNDDLKKLILATDSSKYAILHVASTRDIVNANGRIITDGHQKAAVDNVPGTQMAEEHWYSTGSTIGEYHFALKYDSSSYNGLITAAICDIDDINIFKRLYFSVGYALDKEHTCPKCNMSAFKFYNIKSKKVKCAACDAVIPSSLDPSKIKVSPHNLVWMKDDRSSDYYPTYQHKILQETHKKNSKKVSDAAHFMVIDESVKIKEISIVTSPADAMDAPLIAFIKIADLKAKITSTEVTDSNDRNWNLNDSMDVVEYEQFDSKFTFVNEMQIADDNDTETNNNNNNDREKILSINKEINMETKKIVFNILTKLDPNLLKGGDFSLITNNIKDFDEFDELVTDKMSMILLDKTIAIVNALSEEHSKLTKEISDKLISDGKENPTDATKKAEQEKLLLQEAKDQEAKDKEAKGKLTVNGILLDQDGGKPKTKRIFTSSS